MNIRNLLIEKTSNYILESIDKFINEEKTINSVKNEVFKIVDLLVANQSASVRLASLFLTAYSLLDDKWDFKSVPTGIRGSYGDKKISSELRVRFITLFDNITAFGENLGWKGDVSNTDLSTDPRFGIYLNSVKKLKSDEKILLFEYFCHKAADSRKIPKALPPLPSDYITYSRAMLLFESLLKTHSEGHIQQFLIAALFLNHRKRYNYTIKTHHPHASDKFDNSAGDIEEFDSNGRLSNAYEVTVRPDWKNRLIDFREKMNAYKLTKYTIIASNVNSDSSLSPAKNLLTFLGNSGHDIAVVDINDFVKYFRQSLPPKKFRMLLMT